VKIKNACGNNGNWNKAYLEIKDFLKDYNPSNPKPKPLAQIPLVVPFPVSGFFFKKFIFIFMSMKLRFCRE
jgi:hypothetical protein